MTRLFGFLLRSRYLEMLVPGYAATLTEQVRAFLQHRKAVGIIGFLAMLFFSSTAFSILESAMSAIVPYAYILVMGLGIVLVPACERSS